MLAAYQPSLPTGLRLGEPVSAEAVAPKLQSNEGGLFAPADSQSSIAARSINETCAGWAPVQC